jgi:gluconokinase
MFGPFTVAIDVGSSSVRVLLFDAEARSMEGFGAQLPYKIRTTPDGGAEIDPDELSDLTLDCLDEVHRQVQAAGIEVKAIGGSAFWHSFLGIDKAGKPTFPILHLLDTRAEPYVNRLPDAHSRTGCMPHASYWPAKLLWLAEHRSAALAATAQLVSFPEYLFLQIFGKARASLSMVSATGLWNQNAGDYDAELLAVLPVQREQLADPAIFDEQLTELLPSFQRDWPCFANAIWFPALGDGACNSIGSGCVSADRASLMVGTTGAMRVIVEAPTIQIPRGLWGYRADRKRFILGGALSNGGEVFAWAKRTLQLPKDVEARLENTIPGSHGLTALPFLAGERTPYWRGDLRAAIAGLGLDTEPFDILRALLEGVGLGG